MAIYHFTTKIITASHGKSAVASAAYLSGQKLHSERTGENYNYKRKEEVVYSEVLLPANMPEKFKDRGTLWNTIEMNRKRKDGQYARQFEIALPVEWSKQECIDRSKEFIQEAFIDKGLVADFGLHFKDGNPHIHVMTTLTPLDKNGNPALKRKRVFANSFDEKGKPIYDPSKPSYDPKNKEATKQYKIPAYEKNKDGSLKFDENGQPIQKTSVRAGKGVEYLWEKVEIETNPFKSKKQLLEWRKEWADFANRYLEPGNQIDHRSNEARGIMTAPQIHEGYAAREIKQRTGHSDRCDYNQSIKKENREYRIICNKLAYNSKIFETIGKVVDLLAKLTGLYELTELYRLIGNLRVPAIRRDGREFRRVLYTEASKTVSELNERGRNQIREDVLKTREFRERKRETSEIEQKIGQREYGLQKLANNGLPRVIDEYITERDIGRSKQGTEKKNGFEELVELTEKAHAINHYINKVGCGVPIWQPEWGNEYNPKKNRGKGKTWMPVDDKDEFMRTINRRVRDRDSLEPEL